MMTSLENGHDNLANWSRSIRKLAKLTGTGPDVLQHVQDACAEATPTTHIAFLGAPNVGRSSLLNALIGKRLLPVSALPSQHAFVIESVESGHAEDYSIAGVTHPIEKLKSLPETGTTNQSITVHVHNTWLAARQVSAKESPALDVADNELSDAIKLSLRRVDLVVLVIDSLMPVRRSETMLLSECTRRGLPVIVALTKIDRLSPEDRASIGEYVGKQVRSYASQSPIVEMSIGLGAQSGLEALKESIDDLLASENFPRIRFRQAVEELLAAVTIIATQATAALDLQTEAHEVRNAEGRRRQFAADEQATLWASIENQLQQRRQALEDEIRNGLKTKKQAIADLLQNDLAGRTDIKVWWEREMPFRLSRELQATGESLSGMANRRIAADLAWLQAELVRCFRLPQSSVPINMNVKIEGGEFAKKDVSLWDTNHMRIVARLGQAAAVLVAGRLLLTASLGGATMGLSILAGLAAEQAVTYAASQDRKKVRVQIDDVVERSSHAYALDVSQRLRAGYDEILQALKNEQQRWQKAQAAALKIAGTANQIQETDWSHVIEESKAIEKEMLQAIATVTELPPHFGGNQ